ncbi:hypothetical protein ACUXJ6_001897 [Kocuria palustris]
MNTLRDSALTVLALTALFWLNTLGAHALFTF